MGAGGALAKSSECAGLGWEEGSGKGSRVRPRGRYTQCGEPGALGGTVGTHIHTLKLNCGNRSEGLRWPGQESSRRRWSLVTLVRVLPGRSWRGQQPDHEGGIQQDIISLLPFDL